MKKIKNLFLNANGKPSVLKVIGWILAGLALVLAFIEAVI
jgi:hypothetical protein